MSAPSNAPPTRFDSGISDTEFVIIVCVCSAAGLVGIIIAAICWYKMQQSSQKAAADVDYTSKNQSGDPAAAYRLVGYRATVQGDRKLAQSAQMYHYQHQKQQMIALEKANNDLTRGVSDEESDNDDGDYTVYECPGLAPAGEMEVRNPLFQEDMSSPGSVIGAAALGQSDDDADK